jgi:molybdate transport system ATP-binding protein
MSVQLRHSLGAFELDAAFEFGTQPGVTALFGPSGAGKSTVINAVAGLIQPAFGRIVLGKETLLDTDRGVSVPARLRRVGVVFQAHRSGRLPEGLAADTAALRRDHGG